MSKKNYGYKKELIYVLLSLACTYKSFLSE